MTVEIPVARIRIRPVPAVSASSIVSVLLPVAVGCLGWALACAVFGTATVPSPSMIVTQIRADGVAFYATNLQSTATSAGIGYAIGVVVAITLGIVAGRVRMLTRPLLNTAMLAYTVPVVALSVVLTTIFSGLIPRITVAAVYVLFTTTLATVTGLAAASRSSVEVAAVAGLGPISTFRKIYLPSAVPNVATGMALAVPAAVLGAVIAEMMGGTTGVGVALVTSQRAGLTTRTWAMALATAVAVGAVFALARSVSDRVSGRSPKITTPLRLPEPTIGRKCVSLGLSTGAILAVWYGVLAGPFVPEFIRRTPADIIEYFRTATDSTRTTLWEETVATLMHAGLGFVIGTVAALAVAVLFTVVGGTRSALLPLAVFGQATPFVVILPLVITVLGRGSATAAVAAALVGFFPMLITLDAALSRTPRSALDLMQVNGFGDVSSVLRTRIPFAVPALISAARIAVPASLAGAVLAEYLALDNGLGHLMVEAGTAFDYDQLWAAVVVLTCCSLILGGMSRVVERMVCHRLGLSAAEF
ncbi:ABC transporter permease [Gordonia sp. NPDC003376]